MNNWKQQLAQAELKTWNHEKLAQRDWTAQALAQGCAHLTPAQRERLVDTLTK